MLAEALALSLSARGYVCSVAALDGPISVVAQAAQQRSALVLLDLDLGGYDGLDLVAGLRATGARSPGRHRLYGRAALGRVHSPRRQWLGKQD